MADVMHKLKFRGRIRTVERVASKGAPYLIDCICPDTTYALAAVPVAT